MVLALSSGEMGCATPGTAQDTSFENSMRKMLIALSSSMVFKQGAPELSLNSPHACV